MGDDSSGSMEGKSLSNMRVVDLKLQLEKRGLSKSGSKKELVKRLKQKLELEKLYEESAADGDSEPKLHLDKATEQNEFVKQYLAEQQKIYAQQKEVKRLIELKEQKQLDEEDETDSDLCNKDQDSDVSESVAKSSCDSSTHAEGGEDDETKSSEGQDDCSQAVQSSTEGDPVTYSSKIEPVDPSESSHSQSSMDSTNPDSAVSYSLSDIQLPDSPKKLLSKVVIKKRGGDSESNELDKPSEQETNVEVESEKKLSSETNGTSDAEEVDTSRVNEHSDADEASNHSRKSMSPDKDTVEESVNSTVDDEIAVQKEEERTSEPMDTDSSDNKISVEMPSAEKGKVDSSIQNKAQETEKATEKMEDVVEQSDNQDSQQADSSQNDRVDVSMHDDDDDKKKKKKERPRKEDIEEGETDIDSDSDTESIPQKRKGQDGVEDRTQKLFRQESYDSNKSHRSSSRERSAKETRSSSSDSSSSEESIPKRRSYHSKCNSEKELAVISSSHRHKDEALSELLNVSATKLETSSDRPRRIKIKRSTIVTPVEPEPKKEVSREHHKKIEMEPAKHRKIEMEPAKHKKIEMEPAKHKKIEMEPAKHKKIEMEPAKHKKIEMEPAKHKKIEMEPVKLKKIEIEPAKHKKIEMEPAKHKKIEIEPAKHKKIEMEPVKHKKIEMEPAKHKKIEMEPARHKRIEMEPVKQESKPSHSSSTHDVKSASKQEHTPKKRLSEDPSPLDVTPPKVSYRKLNVPFKKSEDNKDKVEKKRAWNSIPLTKSAMSISTDSLKSLIPDFKVLCSPSVLNETEEKAIKYNFEQASNIKQRHVVQSNDIPVKIEKVPSLDEPKKPKNRRESIKDTPPEPMEVEEHPKRTVLPEKPVSNIIFIRNLVRPFTLLQLKEVLKQTGTFIEEDFWIDKIKSKCLVTYETEEQAAKTRESLHNSRWPASNPKILTVEFVTKEEFDLYKNEGDEPKPAAPVPVHPSEKLGVHVPAAEAAKKKEREHPKERERPRKPVLYVREWDKDKLSQESPERERVRHRSSKSGERGSEKERDRRGRTDSTKEFPREDKESRKRHDDDTPAKLLDDLFQKTKTTPCIYWLPLTEEQVKQKEEERRVRRLEREKRNQEQEEAERVARRKPREKSSRSRSRSPARRR